MKSKGDIWRVIFRIGTSLFWELQINLRTVIWTVITLDIKIDDNNFMSALSLWTNILQYSSYPDNNWFLYASMHKVLESMSIFKVWDNQYAYEVIYWHLNLWFRQFMGSCAFIRLMLVT